MLNLATKIPTTARATAPNARLEKDKSFPIAQTPCVILKILLKQ